MNVGVFWERRSAQSSVKCIFFATKNFVDTQIDLLDHAFSDIRKSDPASMGLGLGRDTLLNFCNQKTFVCEFAYG